MIIVGLGGQFQRVNQAFREFVGYSEKELVGQNLNILMNAEDGKKHGSYLERYMTTKKSVIMGKPGREVIGKHKTGKSIDIEGIMNFVIRHG